MIWITEEQVRAALPMKAAVEAVEGSFRGLATGRYVNRPRDRVVLDSKAMLHSLAAGDNETGELAAKVYSTHPTGGMRFVVLLFASEGAELKAVIDANALGQIRTGAASGVATKYLAREDARTLGLVGTGFQAETQLEAVAAVRELETVRVFGRDQARREAFCARMGERLGLAMEPVGSAEEAVRGADIVTAVTTARRPVVRGEWLAPGVHINAAGSNHPKRQELDGEAVRMAAPRIWADLVAQAKIEAGDLIQACEEGEISWADVGEISAVVSGSESGRSAETDVTLFASQGLAVEDLVVARLVYDVVRA